MRRPRCGAGFSLPLNEQAKACTTKPLWFHHGCPARDPWEQSSYGMTVLGHVWVMSAIEWPARHPSHRICSYPSLVEVTTVNNDAAIPEVALPEVPPRTLLRVILLGCL